MKNLRKRIDKIEGIIEERHRTLPERFEKSLTYRQICDRLKFVIEMIYWVKKNDMDKLNDVIQRIRAYCKGKKIKVIDDKTEEKLKDLPDESKLWNKIRLRYTEIQSDKPLRYDLFWGNIFSGKLRKR